MITDTKLMKCFICNKEFEAKKGSSKYTKCSECKKIKIEDPNFIRKTKEISCIKCGQNIIVDNRVSKALCENCRKNKYIPVTREYKIIQCFICKKDCQIDINTVSEKTIKYHRCEECKGKISEDTKEIFCGSCNKGPFIVSKFVSVFKCEECKKNKKYIDFKESICKICNSKISVGKYSKNENVCDRCKSRNLTIKEQERKIIKCYNSECNNKFEVGIDLYSPRLCDNCLNNGIKIETKIGKCNICSKEIEIPLYSNRYVRCDECISKNLKSENETKIVNCSICKEEIEVSKLLYTNVICDKCKEVGFYLPKYKIAAEKRNLVFLNKYGVDNISQLENIKQIKKEKQYNSFLVRINNLLCDLKLELLDIYNDANTIDNYKCLECNTIFKSSWFDIQQYNNRCPNCYPKNSISKPQQEIYKFILSLGFDESEILFNNRSVIKHPKTNNNLELDIYIPHLNLAIEFDGLYYHSEEFAPKDYHLMKTLLCNEKNIYLIHIFEDEWIYKQDIVKARLKQLLHKSDANRLHARECKIKEISSNIKNEFLFKYHIQGNDTSIIKLGAFYNNELVAVMTFSKGNISKGSYNEEGIYELNRFCSNYNYHIPGIASKLFSFFINNYEYDKIFTYADRRWSNGKLYEKMNFIFEKATVPNYFYVKGLRRIHRFNLRKSIDNPDNLSEAEIRFKQGYGKIWDCGHLKYYYKKDKK